MQSAQELENAITELLPFEGRFIRQMSERDVGTVREIAEKYDLLPQLIQAYSKTNKPYINIDPVREKLSKAKAIESERIELEASNAMSQYLEALEGLKSAMKNLNDEKGPEAHYRAHRLGLAHGYLKFD